MSPALLVCAAAVGVASVAGVVVAGCMVADFLVRFVVGRRRDPP